MWVNPKEHKVVGACLEALRTEIGVTQVELAKRLKKPQSFVSAYESGQRRIDLLELVRIAAALDRDPYNVSTKIFEALDKKGTGRRHHA